MTVLLFLITLLVVAYLAGLIRTLRQRVDVLETQLQWALHNFRAEQEKSVPQQTAKTTNIALQPTLWEAEVFPAESASVQPTPIQQAPEPVAAPPVLPAFDTARPQQQAVPPPFRNRLQEKGRADAQAEPSPVPMATDFNWEQFLGAKMLAWLGGLALFVGIAFFVKYSFERNLVPPWVRVMAGFAIGAGLVGAGVKIRKKDYLITAQTLVATGVVILYAVSFIARSLYHLINTPMLFAVMSGITVAAFSLAIRMDARVVAVLGMLGGFLTPLFVGFSREQPLPLLGYVLVLNAGLLITAKRKNWSFVVPLAAIATLLTEILWIATSLTAGNLIVTLLMIAVITVLFVANAKYNPDGEGEPRSLAAGTLQCFALLATFWFMLTNSHGMPSPAILLPTLFFANAALMTLYALTLNVVPLICGVSACGALLAMWIGKSGSVVSACIAALIYAALNALLPAWIAKWREASKFWPNVASVSGIGLLLLVLFGNSNPGWFFWTILLVLNAVLLAVALVRRNLVLAACGTILTAVLSAYWIIRMDSSASLVQPLLIIGAFALLYFFAARPLSAENESDPNAVYFPAVPAGIPFLLLALLMVRIDMDSPSMLFAFALGLNALLIFATPATARVFPLVALIGTLLLQALWFTGELRISNAGVSLAWFVVFSLFFTAFPLLMKRGDRFDLLPWSVSAVAGPVHFGLIYATARMIWPQMTLPGLIPALLGLPAAAMFVRSRVIAANADEKRQFTGIYGASLLFFITFIFPIQFDRQWLTLGWALEGLALVWLNRRAPAKWLVHLGTALLAVAFVRLAVNPAIFRYYERSTVPVLNWYLYSYGITAVALFVAARWVPRDKRRFDGWFNAMATVLLFLLINIEIADLFSQGQYLAFDFTGNFARDMTYSIAWSLFALTLLVVGVKKESAPVRYAGLGLMGITLLKLFLHDLTQLDALFRIGAFVGVAIILITASWLYQRFISASRRSREAAAPQ